MKGPASILIEICGDGVRNPPGQQITSWTSPRCESYGHALWGVSGLSPWLWRVLWACWQRSISSASFWFCWSFSGSLPTSSCLGSTWSMPLSLSQGWRGKILTNSVIKIFGSACWLWVPCMNVQEVVWSIDKEKSCRFIILGFMKKSQTLMIMVRKFTLICRIWDP